MTQLISAFTFASAFPPQNLSQHAVITDDDGKICTLSHQLFSLKKLVKSNPDKMEFYKGIAKQIFLEKYGSRKKRGCIDRIISAIGNFFMGRGLKSSDYMLKKIRQSNTLNVPKKIKPFFDLASKKFIKEIMNSDLYLDEEKARLTNCTSVYCDNGKPVHKRTWLSDNIICNHLRGLALENTDFGTIAGPGQDYYENLIEDKHLDTAVNTIVTNLPAENGVSPFLFAHPIRVNGNHHTALFIDVKKGTVEYYNSFGSDSQVKTALLKLKEHLSVKYSKTFVYQHKTKNTRLQLNTYDCGVWTSLFVKERIKQGSDFNLSSLRPMISKYRKHIYAQCFKLSFYSDVGFARLQRAYPGCNSYLDEVFKATKKGLDPYYYKWCRSGEIPAELQEIIQKQSNKSQHLDI